MDEINKSINLVNEKVASISKEKGTQLQPLSPLDADALSKVKPFKLPEQPTSSAAEGLNTKAVSLGQQARADQKTIAEEKAKALEKDTKGIKSIFSRLSGVNADKQDALEEGGVNDLKREIDDISAQMDANDLATRRRIEKIETENPEGMFGSRGRGEIKRIERENARENADLAIVLSAKTQKWDTAYSIISDKADAETEDLRNQLEMRKFFYEENKEALTTAEQREFDLLLQEDERAYTDKRALEQQKGELQLQLAKNGAPMSVISRINSAESWDAALSLSAPYLAEGTASVPTIKTINGVDYQWNASTGQWETPTVGGMGGDSAQVTKSLDQLRFLQDTTQKAKELAGASGASGVSKFIGDKLKGDTKFRQLETYVDTLRTNVLTLMTDPGIKKFFGPQMSEADVRLMTAAGTTLRPDSLSPKQMREEIARLEDLFGRMETTLTGVAVPNDLNTLAEQKGFDLSAARAEGYTDEEIRQFLNQ